MVQLWNTPIGGIYQKLSPCRNSQSFSRGSVKWSEFGARPVNVYVKAADCIQSLMLRTKPHAMFLYRPLLMPWFGSIFIESVFLSFPYVGPAGDGKAQKGVLHGFLRCFKRAICTLSSFLLSDHATGLLTEVRIGLVRQVWCGQCRLWTCRWRLGQALAIEPPKSRILCVARLFVGFINML